MGTFETKWGPNGDPKSPKGPHWGPGSPIGDPSGSSEFIEPFEVKPDLHFSEVEYCAQPKGRVGLELS